MTVKIRDTKGRTRVRFYRMRNRLKDKIGGGDGDGVAIDMRALEAAAAEFDRMAEDYPDWVQSHIKELYAHCRRSVDTPEDRARHFGRINEIAHDMRGQGGTFGYPLISHFGDSLYDASLFATGAPISDNHVEIVMAHVDAMNAVIKGRISGDGGAIGRELRLTLEMAIEQNATV